MKRKQLSLTFAVLLGFCCSAFSGTTTWQGGALETEWNVGANWTAGIPTSTDDVVFSTVPSGIVEITGGEANAGSITVNDATGGLSINSSASALNLYGAFTNNDTVNVNVQSTVNLMADLTLSGSSAAVYFSGITKPNLHTISLGGGINFQTDITFSIASALSYGHFVLQAGSVVDITGVTGILFSPSAYTGVLNDSFTLFDSTLGTINGMSEIVIDSGTLPTLSGGLSWNLSNFTTNGTISVVPEPSSFALLLLGAGFFVARRRK